MVEYRPSADRAEYAAQSEEERRKTRERQQRPDGSYYGGTRPQGPQVEIVDRDITMWREQLAARANGQEVPDITDPLGVMGAQGAATQDDTSVLGDTPDSIDLDAAWSDRRWVLYEQARADMEGTDAGEIYGWLSRDRDPNATGDADAARFEAMNRPLARETIEDWKARMKRAEEYGTTVPLGDVAMGGVGPRGRPVPVDPQTGEPVEPVSSVDQEPRYMLVTDPATGMSRQVRVDGVYKAEQTPSAKQLADGLKANGQKNMVFIGWEGDYGAGQSRINPVLMEKEALYYFDNFPPEMQERVMEITRAYYEGMDPQFSWNEKRWRTAVDTANNALYTWGVYKSPFEAYEEALIKWRAQEEEKRRTSGGGGGGFYGGGGGGSATTQRITLTSPTDAYYLLNQAMTQYLGRQANRQELAQFVKLLNAQERANPVVATMDGNTTVQEGGFNPATFAEQFARGQEGSAEFQAATTFLDALLGAMNSETGVL